MSDMADQALSEMMDIDGIQQGNLDFNSAVEAGEEELLYDYDCSRKRYVFDSGSKKKPTGSGPCPLCKAETVIRKGPFGEFYGCVTFPKCKGNRDK